VLKLPATPYSLNILPTTNLLPLVFSIPILL
jgi:hypothetical protein